MKTPPLTNWKIGLRVRTKRLIWQATQPNVPEGIIGYLGSYYRYQDGVECWSVWTVDPKYTIFCFGNIRLFGASHIDLEPIGGKIEFCSFNKINEDFKNLLDEQIDVIISAFNYPATD